jgi:hypothetical protein
VPFSNTFGVSRFKILDSTLLIWLTVFCHKPKVIYRQLMRNLLYFMILKYCPHQVLRHWIIPEMDEIDDLHQQFVKKYFE